ncbi:MAG: bifunctional (p)ppGpp synthetase/guanosine-3',5'-bis(diphosphate) 3'-pyrophosphohydrolase [Bacteroidales bacterium]|nr:bifunctional (p)ppGpp synthetase/guanosine-3',5'-bis(diphosphate) 3'-pyrophosphohydrolase [Bacteroidales bacterium]
MSFSEFTPHDYELISNSYEELMAAARPRCANAREIRLVQKAFDFANEAHKNVRRRSGEPYILHPLAVAKIVVSQIGLGCKSICAALLHDVVEDTDYTIEDVENLFGEKIASLVDGLTKIKNVLDNEDRNKPAQVEKSMQAENIKRILLTLNDDVRVVLIKLADRLHNCRTIEYMPEHKRDKILSETMFIFIPLAHRLGLYEVKSEMENIWLRYKEPDAFRDISHRISLNAQTKGGEIDRFITPISDALKAAGFDFEIKKRIKTPYSIWRKMQTKGIDFDQVYDLYAVRIIFNPDSSSRETERDQCYHIFSIITGIYRYQPSRMRDWVKQPKSNGYEALHCTLMSEAGIWIEVQIRSRRMDDIAERGIAAHWAYKKDGYISENDSEMDKWLQKVKDILVDSDVNALELLDIIHNDLTSSDIVVFTPKGEQRTIQKGFTALDFAYSIHTDIGNKAIAAKVNLRLVPLSTVLRSGDQVEIITSRSGHPKREWLQFLVSRKATGIVKDYFKIPAPEQDVAAPEPDPSAKVLPSGGGMHYTIATCCSPIPGDPIIGFRSESGIITVHKKTCKLAENIASKFGKSIVVPSWEDISADAVFPVSIEIRGIDRVGLLRDITYYISRVMSVNMQKLDLGCEGGIFEGHIEMLIHDKDVLEALIDKLSGIEGIQSVIRKEI